ncbi:MAG: sulfurtransferase [Acidimicrobiia bacterium]
MNDPLISATDLLKVVDDPNMTIVDCRWYLAEPDAGITAYRRAHLPHALYASLDTDLSASEGSGRHPLPAPEVFAATMGSLGIGANSKVVAYDDSGGAVAARLWWMLTDQGHDAVAVLDGGIQGWTAAGGSLVDDQPAVEPRTFVSRPWRHVVDQDEVANRGNRTVIDARSTERFRGDEEPVDRKAGHIPGARSLPLTNNLREDLTFLSPPELRHQFGDAGISSGSDVISQCGSGVTACHNILAMEVAGLGRPDLYVGSWSDWSNSDRPIAVGTEE